jgi:hypothetical protein
MGGGGNAGGTDGGTGGTGGTTGGTGGTGGCPSGLVAVLQAEAANLTDCTSCFSEAAAPNAHVVGIEAGDALAFGNVPMSCVNHVKLNVSSPFTGGQFEIRADAIDGPLLGLLELQTATGDWTSHELLSVDLDTTVDGAHTLYVVTLASFSGWVAAIERVELHME